MRLEFTEKFKIDVKEIDDLKIKERIITVIEECEIAQSLSEIRNLKKLKGYDKHFRIKVGNFRIGLSLQQGVLVFSRCLHRKDIYRYFPE